jgi:hypothetical protein
MRAVDALRSVIRSTVDPAAREWLAKQDDVPAGPKRLSRGIEPVPAESPDDAPATAPAVVPG